MQSSKTEAQPRPHHYQFAHQSLPAHFFNDGAQFTKLLQMDGKVFLHYLWTTVAEDLSEDERLPYGLELEHRKEGKFDVYLITMPPPTEPSEAFYVILASDGRKYFYYTLDLCEPNPKEPTKTKVHGEWISDATRREHGKMGSADIEAFASTCLKLLK